MGKEGKGDGKRDEPPHTSLHIANLHHTSQWHSTSGEKVMERGTNPRTLLCTLQIYTTLVNGIALQEKSEEWSERWGKGGKGDEPRALLCTLQIYTTLVNGIALQVERGKVMERGTNPRTLLCALQIYTTLVNGIALQGERGER